LDRAKKEMIVAEIHDKAKKMSTAILADFQGLNVSQMTDLRNRLREQGVEIKVAKNTLLRIAAKDTELEKVKDFFLGPTALVFGYKDPIAPSKILVDYAKDQPALKIKAGIVEGKVLKKDEIEQLAELPSREVLIAQLLMLMKSPVTRFVNVLASPLRKTLLVFNMIKEKKASS